MRSRRCVSRQDSHSAPLPSCSESRNEASKTGRARSPNLRNTSSGSSVFTSSTKRIKSVRGVLGVSGPQSNISEKIKKPVIIEITGFFWSCYPDSNWGPHPYQVIFGVFYNDFRLFLVVFVPNGVVSRTFEKCSLRCFHICLWWNCGQAAILRIRPLIVRNHIRCISISYSPEFFTLYTAFFRQYIIECL